MPKVVLMPENKYKQELIGVIKAKQGYFRLSNEDVATAAGVTERTMSNRFHRPELFTVEQLYRLCKKLKFEVVINENGIQCRFERSEKK